MKWQDDQRMLFGDPPIERTDAVRWKVERVKARLNYRVRCLTRKLIWAAVHYYRGRSVPCVGDGCRVCVDLSARWYAFVPVTFVKEDRNQGQAILELPAGAAMNLGGAVENATENGEEAWLGLEFIARRANKNMRSPVVCEFVACGKSVVEVDRLTVMASLCRMWGVPIIDESTDEVAWKEMVTQRLDSDEHYIRTKTAYRQ